MDTARAGFAGARSARAIRATAAIPVALVLVLLSNVALAQQALIPPAESGRVGLAGMLAGLLLFALVAL
jgi:hypothetical protein